MTGDYWRDTLRHFEHISDLTAGLRGVITGALKAADKSEITAEQALEQIRAKHIETESALKAAWDEYAGGTR